MLSSVTTRHHRDVVACFEALLEANPDRALSVPEICTKIEVPGRTLRVYRPQLLRHWVEA